MDTKRIIVVVVFVLFLMHVCRVQAGGGGDEIEGDERSVDGDKRPLRRSDRVRDNREGKQQAPVCSSEISDPELEADKHTKNDEEDNPSKRKRLFIENEPPQALSELVARTAEQWLDYSTFELRSACTAVGLSDYGSRSKLADRLAEFYSNFASFSNRNKVFNDNNNVNNDFEIQDIYPPPQANLQSQSLDTNPRGSTTNIREQPQGNNAHTFQSSFLGGGSILQQNSRQMVDNPPRYSSNMQQPFGDTSARISQSSFLGGGQISQQNTQQWQPIPINTFNQNNAGSVRLRPTTQNIFSQTPSLEPQSQTNQIASAVSEAIRSTILSLFSGQGLSQSELTQNFQGALHDQGIGMDQLSQQHRSAMGSSPVWQAINGNGGNTRNFATSGQNSNFATLQNPQARNAMISGSALPAMSQKNLLKIRNGEYVDLSTLTDIFYQSSDKLELRQEGESVALVPKDKSKPIKTLPDWLAAWNIFMQAYMFFYPDQAQALVIYQGTIIQWASQYSFSRVVAYDCHFRTRLSLDPTAAWDQVDERLFNFYLRRGTRPLVLCVFLMLR